MRSLKLFSLLVFLTQTSLLFGQSQQERLNAESALKLKNADAELTAVYNKILEEYENDQEFIQNIKTSHALWINFRRAELLMKYPDRGAGHYGSAHVMCINNYLTEMTVERVKKLKTWLIAPVEGDLCSGSVKTRK